MIFLIPSKKENSSMPDESGFTLIELMIVVGIIGILVAIAIPNFAEYQSKARQSEAKLALAIIYTGEKSFYSEYAAYITSMDAIGYAPEGLKRFYTTGWVAAGGPVTGYAGSTANANWININNTFTGCPAANPLPAASTTDVQTFLVGSTGCIRTGANNQDYWNMTDTKTIANNLIGL